MAEKTTLCVPPGSLFKAGKVLAPTPEGIELTEAEIASLEKAHGTTRDKWPEPAKAKAKAEPKKKAEAKK